MIKTGLVSVTFRNLSPEQIVKLVADADLQGIEWGGDIHVPHGDNAKAAKVRQLTANSGLSTFAYGSYYRLGRNNTEEFKRVLDTAVCLNAPTIRVWAGEKGSADTDVGYRKLIIHDAQSTSMLASEAGISVSLEFHRGTLTDTSESAIELVKSVNAPNLHLYWQPNPDISLSGRLHELNDVLPYLTNVHAFYWTKGNIMHPLHKGIDEWKQYINIVKNSGKDHNVMLEFVADEQVENFVKDAATIKNLID